jgi:hypothetical protein
MHRPGGQCLGEKGHCFKDLRCWRENSASPISISGEKIKPQGAAVSDEESAENSSAKPAKAKPRGRAFQPGVSGNPAGKPRGTRNRTSLLFQNRVDEKGLELIDAGIAMALAGDATIMKALLSVLIPARRERVSLNLESIRTLGDAVEASAQILDGLAAGALSSSDGAIMNAALRQHTEMLALANIEERLKRLEQGRLNGGRH